MESSDWFIDTCVKILLVTVLYTLHILLVV